MSNPLSGRTGIVNLVKKYLDMHNFIYEILINFAAKVAHIFPALVLKKIEEQRLEAEQMKFLRHLIGITKLDKEKNQSIRQKTGAQNIVKEIKQYQKKWLQHVQRMDTD